MEGVAFALIFIIVATFAWGALLAAPWVPTLKGQRDLLITNLPVSPTATIYDLGCGSGSILFAFADAHPEATCIGYDVAILPLLLGTVTKFRHYSRYKNVHLRFGNFFTKHFSDADVVVAFLMQKAYPKFLTKLSTELRPGTLVAFEAWPLADVPPTHTFTAEQLVPWYVYTAPIL